ncbi:MAG: YCF48-related protein [Acidobacteriota bacterium]
MRKPILFIIIVFMAASTGFAGWSRGGLFGADVRALVADPRNPDTLFLGTSQGEVYISSDGGRFWSNPRDGVPFPGYVVDNLVVDRYGRVWAACWGLWGGGVIAVSADGGKTWSRRDAGLEEFSVRAMAVDSRNPEVLFVGGLTGVYRSRDSGQTWTQISDRENVESLAVDPRDDNRLYVGTWRQAWRTDDGGATWVKIDQGMVLDTDVFTINIDPANPDSVWLSTCGWVYSSANRGNQWTRYKNGFNNRRIQSVAIDPTDSHSIYAGSVAGLYRTSDSGQGWELISGEDFVVNAVVLHKGRPNRIVVATEGDGIYVSQDKGKTFQRSSHGLRNVRIASLAVDPDVSGRIFAAVLFGGRASGIYQSANSGQTWDRLNETKLPEVLCIAVRHDAEPKFLVGTEQGVFWSDDGKVWTHSEPQMVPVRVDKILQFNQVRLFAASSEGVLTSKDAGKSWYRLGDAKGRTADIALGTIDGKRALYALTETGMLVFDGAGWSSISGGPEKGRTLAVSTEGNRELVVVAGVQGVQSGHVDAQRHWHSVSSPKLAFASVLESGDALGRGVYLTSRDATDLFRASGDSWKTVPLPGHSLEIAAIAEDPFHSGRFYLGTGGQGVFIYAGSSTGLEPTYSAGSGGETK